MAQTRAEAEALVLDCRDHGEADKIITLFCRRIGRLSCIAKGAHRSKKRFVNKLELFSHLHITYSPPRTGSLAVLTDAELHNSFIGLRSNFPGYQAASVFREFLLLATRERVNDDTLFHLSLWTYREIDRGATPNHVLAVSLIKLFDFIGYRPDFTACQTCGTKEGTEAAYYFSPRSGGMFCHRCRPLGERDIQRVSPGTRHMILSVQQQPVTRLARFKPTHHICQELLDCFYRYGCHMFQKDIHSWKYLNTA